MTSGGQLQGKGLTYRLLTKEALAEALSVAKRTVEAWVQAQYLPPPVRIGRRAYWRSDEFQGWLDARFEEASAPAATCAGPTGAASPPEADTARRTTQGRPRSALPPEIRSRHRAPAIRARARR